MKQVIRAKGWGRKPDANVRAAHKGQWLWRDSEGVIGGWCGEYGVDDYEFLAIDGDANPVDVVAERKPTFVVKDLSYYRQDDGSWLVCASDRDYVWGNHESDATVLRRNAATPGFVEAFLAAAQPTWGRP